MLIVLTPAAQAQQECEVIDFSQFTHADPITSIDLFGGDITINVAAFRNRPLDPVNATAYDTDYSIGEGGCTNALNSTHGDTQIPPSGFCGDCDGIIAQVPDVDFCVDGDDTQGGTINFSGFSNDFIWEIPSYAAVDDDGGQDIILRVGVGLTQVGTSTGLGNGTVEIVSTIDHTFSDVAEFELLGSGGIDNITVCREGPPDCSIGDFVWEDADRDGCQGDAEGIEGVVVKLFDGCFGDEIATTTTDATGFYKFDGLECEKDYGIQFVDDPTDIYEQTTADQMCVDGDPDESDKEDSDCGDEGKVCVPASTLPPGTFNDTIDCGYVCEGVIGDRVWLDANGTSGCQDPNEPGIMEVIVNLFQVDGCPDVQGLNPFMTTTTDNQGKYLFEELCPGDYRVTFDDPQGRDNTIVDQDCEALGLPDSNTKDSDCGGDDECVELTVDNAVDVTIDCGKVPPPECDLVVDKKCLVETPEDGDDCDVVDKPVSLTFIYTGEDCSATSHNQDPGKVSCSGDPDNESPVEVVYTGTGKNADKFTVSPASVNLNGEVTISRTDGKNFEAETMLEIRQNGSVLQELEFHTSCSQPLSVGDQFGAMLLNVFSGKNGTVGPPEPPPVPSDNCTVILGPELACPELKDAGIDLTSITFMYNDEGCAASNNPQGGKASCSSTGDPGGPGTPVTVTASDKDGKNAYEVVPTTVATGESFIVTNGGDKFKADSKFTLVGPDGTQVNFFHTSCSQTLAPGDKFGGIEVLALNGQGGGTDVTYFYEVTNLGDPLTAVTLDDDQFGPIAGPFDLATGETQSFEKTVSISETTTNVATVAGTLEGTSITCDDTDEVTVTVEEPPEPPEACIKDVTKVGSITFRFTAEDCSASDNDQGDKAKCTGSAPLTTPISVEYTGKNPGKVTVEPSSGIGVGDTFKVTSTDKLEAATKLEISNVAGDLAQSLEIHTSCSQPLAVGDQFGSLVVDDLELVPK